MMYLKSSAGKFFKDYQGKCKVIFDCPHGNYIDYGDGDGDGDFSIRPAMIFHKMRGSCDEVVDAIQARQIKTLIAGKSS